MSNTSELHQEPMTETCRNCGHAFAEGDKYCANCAQKRKVSLTVSGIVHEFIHTTLHLDGKFFKMLHHLFVPGRLTNDFIAGKQKRYPHPVQFFIVVTAAFLLTFWKVAAPAIEHRFSSGFNASVQTFGDIYPPVLGSTVSYAARVEAFFSDSTNRSSKLSDALKDSLMSEVFSIRRDSVWLDFSRTGRTEGGSVKLTTFVPLKDLFVMDPDSILEKYPTSKDQAQSASLFGSQFLKIIQNPGEYVHKLIGNLAITTIVMLLIQAFVLHLMYFRKKRLYAEHVLFLMNIATVTLLSLIVMMFLSVWLNGTPLLISWMLWLLGFFSFQFFSLRNVYPESVGRTTLHFLIYSSTYLIIGISVFVLSVLTTVFLFS